ncbi:MAG: hypothetical protein D6744_18260, partial [Planctomycetota bacterium]
MKRSFSIVRACAIAGALLALAGGAFAGPTQQAASTADVLDLLASAAQTGAAHPGHPRFTKPVGPPADSPLQSLLRADPNNPPLPPLAPLAQGRYVNYDSPLVKALALSSDGSRLYAANQPGDSLVI